MTSGLIRLGLLLVGGAIIAAAWMTPDEMWSRRYWIERLQGNSGEIDIRSSQMGGVERAKYLLIGVGMVLLAIAWPWLVDWFGPHAQQVR